MRILHLDPDDIDNPLSGGGPRRTFEICRRLARRHEITILTPTFPGSTPEMVRDGVRYVRLGRRIGNHGSSHHITYFFALPRAVRELSYDLLIEDFMPPASVTFNPLLARAPVVASVQWFFARMLAKQYHIPFHWAENAGLRFYSNFVVLSEAMRRHILARRPKARVALIENGISEDLFTVPEAPGRTILYVGRVDMRQKGLDLLLQAYALLPEPRPTLVIAGLGWEEEGVERLARELGVGGTLQFVGRVNAAQRRRLLERCRFVAFPSREETFGMVITEACAAARPVVHFDVPPMNEVASGAGCLSIPAFDVRAYANGMAQLLSASDAEVAARGQACRSRVAAQRWDLIAVRQEAFYLEVCECRREA
ncbi:MAG: glycosyltransferase family 4 protein [Methylocella sp.]